MKFCQNLQFLPFAIFVAEIKNKNFCKLDKILRNFCSLQIFVFVTIYEIFGFEFYHFKQWSCDISERYCILPITNIVCPRFTLPGLLMANDYD